MQRAVLQYGNCFKEKFIIYKFGISKIPRFVTDMYNLTIGNVFFLGGQKLLSTYVRLDSSMITLKNPMWNLAHQAYT